MRSRRDTSRLTASGWCYLTHADIDMHIGRRSPLYTVTVPFHPLKRAPFCGHVTLHHRATSPSLAANPDGFRDGVGVHYSKDIAPPLLPGTHVDTVVRNVDDGLRPHGEPTQTDDSTPPTRNSRHLRGAHTSTQGRPEIAESVQ